MLRRRKAAIARKAETTPACAHLPHATCERHTFSKRILNHSNLAHRTFKQFYFARVEFRSLHQ
ncbi:hypothetical protein XI08_33490 [Bradyrhizobium sp. CCBAU 11361]|nr:hypothetical protein [Bradyrhizobium sp. CCBAU 11361]